MQNSVLSPKVHVNSYSDVRESILMDNVEIGRHCRIRKTIIEEDVVVPPRTTVGYNLEEDRKHFHVTPSGIVVIPQGTKLPELP